MKDVSVLAAKRLGISRCGCNALLRDVARQMNEEDISSLVVVDEDGYLEGIITRTDVMRAALAAPKQWAETPCCEWMTTDVVTVQPATSLESAARILQSRHIHRVVVAQPEGERLRPLAVVSDGDILYHLAREED